jgi:hypothetical protein
VGPKRKKCQVHKKLLCDKSPFFQKAFSSDSNFKEAAEATMHLPEDDPTTFDRIINWLYRDQLPTYPGKGIRVGGRFELEKALLDIFIFAEKYCMEVLANRVMDLLQDIHLGDNTIPYYVHVKLVFSSCHEKSKLRLYLAATSCYLFSFPRVGTDVENARSYSKLPREVPDYGADITEIQYELGFMIKERARVDPRNRAAKPGIGQCYFHTHSEEEVRLRPCSLESLFHFIYSASLLATLPFGKTIVLTY